MRPLLEVGSAASNKVDFAPAGSKMVDADANKALRDIEIVEARYRIKFLHAMLASGNCEVMDACASLPTGFHARRFWARRSCQ